MSQLDQLRQYTTIVADTGDFALIRQYAPTDSTTNPSLIFHASQKPEYRLLVDNAIEYGKQNCGNAVGTCLGLVLDKAFVNFGLEILKIIPGRVSVEVDARLSFETEPTVERARRIIGLFEEAGIGRDRILIKIAATWEGIRACEQLEREGIHCNMTLIFSFAQAVAAAEAGATLISPFVGRILDWHKKARGLPAWPADEVDPGVASVRRIYTYFKQHGHATVVMGASFRNTDEITALAGCDYLTISPALLDQLAQAQGEVTRCLSPECAHQEEAIARVEMTEARFRWMLNEDPMATEKLSEGIRLFARDIVRLEETLRPRI
eukprot:gnl/Trimastix_PCT/3452.p1 GENE.gnl/Trimastix_PCT/3452~~gnl/Trimastix_PCT/3452.p1  ORF type:complete len:334 (+),score=70.99 gnl/Trimastix_PCT/3452:38-1003(+)